jgi:hypothetical protein
VPSTGSDPVHPRRPSGDRSGDRIGDQGCDGAAPEALNRPTYNGTIGPGAGLGAIYPGRARSGREDSNDKGHGLPPARIDAVTAA